MKINFLLTLFLFSTLAYSAGKEEKIKTGALKQLVKMKEDRRKKEFILPPIKRVPKKTAKAVILEEIEESGIYLGAIKAGTRIINIDLNEETIIPKDITVRLYNMSDSKGFKYVLSQDDEVYYKVKSSGVSDLKAITDMHRGPKIFKRIPKVRTLKVYDESFKMFFQGLFAREAIGGSFARQATNTTVPIGTSLRYQLASYFEWYMPAELGLALEWENTTYLSDVFHNITSKSMNIGLSARSKKIYLIEGWPMRVGATFYWSPVAKLTSNSARFGNTSSSLSQTSLEVFTQVDFDNDLGTFFAGFNLRSKWQKFSEVESNFDTTNTVNDLSIGFFIGQGFSSTW